MAFQIIEKFNFCQFSAELKQKLKFFAKILTVNSTEGETVFENLNHIIFLTCVASENPKNYVSSLAYQKVVQLNFVVPFFSPFGLKISIVSFEIEVLRNIWKKNEQWTGKCHPVSTENHCLALILLLWKIDVSALIRVESALFRSNNFWIRGD